MTTTTRAVQLNNFELSCTETVNSCNISNSWILWPIPKIIVIKNKSLRLKCSHIAFTKQTRNKTKITHLKIYIDYAKQEKGRAIETGVTNKRYKWNIDKNSWLCGNKQWTFSIASFRSFTLINIFVGLSKIKSHDFCGLTALRTHFAREKKTTHTHTYAQRTLMVATHDRANDLLRRAPGHYDFTINFAQTRPAAYGTRSNVNGFKPIDMRLCEK